MKKIFLFITLMCSCSLLANWHSWETPPKKNQLYMIVNMAPCEKPENRQILIITHFDDRKPICRYSGEAWWDVRSHDILRWFNQGSMVIYCPSGFPKNFTKRIEGILASEEIKE